MEEHDNRCSHHRIDHCEWPQCNPTCPDLYSGYGAQAVDYRAMLVSLAQAQTPDVDGESDELLQMLLRSNNSHQ